MKLNHILEGHWKIITNYPNSIVSGEGDDERLSFLVDPKQRDEYTKNMGLSSKKEKKKEKKNAKQKD